MKVGNKVECNHSRTCYNCKIVGCVGLIQRIDGYTAYLLPDVDDTLWANSLFADQWKERRTFTIEVKNLELLSTPVRTSVSKKSAGNDNRVHCYSCSSLTKMLDTGLPSSAMRICTVCGK